MRLKSLSITNFRGIAQLELLFPETAQTTVLVGINGAGKSSVLDAIALALIHLEATQDVSTALRADLQPEDVRIGADELRVAATAEILQGGVRQALAWRFDVEIPSPHRFLVEVAANAPEPIRWEGIAPALAYYSVDRMVRAAHSEGPAPGEHDAGALGIRSTTSDYATFFQWFEDLEDLENERIREDPSYRDPVLEMVRHAIEALLPGVRKLRVRRARGQPGERAGRSRLVVTKDGQTLELGQLSHGERGLLAMAGDIARRLAPDALSGVGMRPGIVLIDEIDLHLHPQWQREVVPRLERTFPSVQFIVTTHSPQVVSQLHPDSVRILDGFALVPATPPTYGRDTNAILSDIMGVEERPRFASERLRAIAELIDEERWPQARVALAELARDFGAHDGEILRLGTMLDVLEAAQ